MCTRPPITGCVVARPKGLQSRAARRSRPWRPGLSTLHLPYFPHSAWITSRTATMRGPVSDTQSPPVPASIVRPAVVYFLLFGAVAAYFPYIAVYFRSIGLGLPAIGLLAALNAGVAVIAAPAWGALVDRDPRRPRPARRRRPLVGGRRDMAGGDPRAAPRRDRRRDPGGGLGRSRPDARQPHDPDRRQEPRPIRTGAGVWVARVHDRGARRRDPDRPDGSPGHVPRLRPGAVPDRRRRVSSCSAVRDRGDLATRENLVQLRVRPVRARSGSDAAAVLHRFGSALDRGLGGPHVPVGPPRPARREQRPRRPRLDARARSSRSR